MFFRKLIFSFLVLNTCATLALVASVENSIIPTLEKFECIENLNPKKYSDPQYSEISDVLSRKSERVRLVSYNMLFNLYDHNLEEVNRWPQRLPRIVEILEDMQPDVMGVQELYQDQLNDLLPFVDSTYAFYAKPCEDGELNGIFYRKDRFEVIDSKVLYISKTPTEPASETLTMLKLRDLRTGQQFGVFNVHLAFGNINKRDFQARFIAEQVEDYSKNTPVLLMGDLNLFPNRLDLEKLPFLDGDYVNRILTKGSLKNARDVSILGLLGPLSTFSNSPDGVVPFEGTGTPGVFLDNIYVSKEVTVLMQAVQPGTVSGHFPSDHMPLLVDFIVN